MGVFEGAFDHIRGQVGLPTPERSPSLSEDLNASAQKLQGAVREHPSSEEALDDADRAGAILSAVGGATRAPTAHEESAQARRAKITALFGPAAQRAPEGAAPAALPESWDAPGAAAMTPEEAAQVAHDYPSVPLDSKTLHMIAELARERRVSIDEAARGIVMGWGVEGDAEAAAAADKAEAERKARPKPAEKPPEKGAAGLGELAKRLAAGSSALGYAPGTRLGVRPQGAGFDAIREAQGNRDSVRAADAVDTILKQRLGLGGK